MVNEITVKGLFILQTLKILEDKFPTETKEIQEKLQLTNIQPLNEYPVRYQVDLEAAGVKLLFPNLGDEGYVEFGKLSFHSFASNLVGKILLTLAGKSIKTLLLSSPRFWGAMTKGLDIETKELSENAVSIRFHNNPYTMQGLKGLFMEGLQYFKINGTVEGKIFSQNDHEYIISWNKNTPVISIPEKE